MNDTRVLSPQQIEAFRRDGYLAPVRVLEENEIASHRARLEAFEAAQGSPLKGGQRNKAYLLFTWAYEIMTHPRLLDTVEDLLGPDLVVYHSTAWIKEPRSPGFVSWHQDSTYFGLEPLQGVTAWVALSPASSQAGCVRVVPRSHEMGQLPADMRPDKNNLLTSGQTVKFNVDDASTVEMPLAPGEVSLHHVCTIHGSAGNDSDDRRIGLCLHYMPASVRPMPHLVKAGALCHAIQVRGRPHHDLFPPEPAPKTDNGSAEIAAHAAAVDSYRRMVGALGHSTASRLD